jgi:hypothetical protein
MTAEQTARAVLAKASAYDPMFRNPDPIILAAWTEALGTLDIGACLAVVTEHYRTETRSLMPADVIAGVKRETGGSLPYHRPMREVLAEIEEASAPSPLELER